MHTHAPNGTHRTFSGLALRPSLVKALWQPTPRQTKPQPRSTAPHSKYPDELVLEVRRLHETENMSCAKITQHINSLGYTVLISWVRGITDYVNRPKLEPEKGRRESYLTTGDQS